MHIFRLEKLEQLEKTYMRQTQAASAYNILVHHNNSLFEFFVFQSPYRTVLKDTAIPTVFDLTSHLKNPHARHRKRIKELVRTIYVCAYMCCTT